MGETKRGRSKRVAALLGGAALLFAGTGCQHVRLLRPNVLGQLDPKMAALVNELPGLDRPNENMVGQIYARGGLAHAKLDRRTGLQRIKMYAIRESFLWSPAIIVMERAGELELEIHNDDDVHHIAYMPSIGDPQVLMLPDHSGGRMRIRLDQPGFYWYGCPVANHFGRGMFGFIIVKGDTPPEARLDRPKQPRP
jgi:PQQ system protein